MINITIHTDNAAFHDPDGNRDSYHLQLEVSRILRKLADKLEVEMQCGSIMWALPIMDLNGNRVGDYEVIDDE